MTTARLPCVICATLGPGELIELDVILGDPMRWPATVWGGFAPPKGGLPASYRRFGAQRMGQAWLTAKGYTDIGVKTLRTHIRYDVPVQSVDVDELIARGMIALAPDGKKGEEALGAAIDPLAYIKFYNKGIEIGLAALGLLAARVEDLVDKKEDVPLSLIKMMADVGTKLAMSQAAIKSSGKQFGDAGDEDDAFRGGGDISPRFGSSRVRSIDGESRAVTDEGLADRTHYNERARQEGGAPIGGR